MTGHLGRPVRTPWSAGSAPRLILWATVVAGVVLATPAPALAEDVAVDIHGYEYHAPTVTLPAGGSVTWTNSDTARHDVASTAGPEAFASPELGQGESFTHTFSIPGAYAYLCTIHPDMVGMLTVTAAPTTSASTVDLAGATTTTVRAAPSGVVAAPAAAVDGAGLGDAAGPYLEYAAVVAAIVVTVGLLFGVRLGRGAPPG